MRRRYDHVIQLRVTRQEWRQIDELAQLRGITVEDLLREALRLSPPPSDTAHAHESHLRIVRRPSATCRTGAG